MIDLISYALNKNNSGGGGSIDLSNYATKSEVAAVNTQIGSVTLSTTWTGATSPYSQIITITGATATSASKIDFQPTAAQIASLISDGVQSLIVENNSGILTAYALGAAPSAAMTVQCTLTEVAS